MLGNREVPIPEHIDIFHLTREMPASEKTALRCVMEVDEERLRLEKLAEALVDCTEEGKMQNVLLHISNLGKMTHATPRCLKIWHFALECAHSLHQTN